MEQAHKNIFDYIEIIYRRKWMLIMPLILGTGIGAFISFKLPAYYRSTTLILVEQQQVPEAYVKPTDITPVEKRLSTINQQIMSRTNLEKIIDNFNLYKGDNAQAWGNPLFVLRRFLGRKDKAPAKEDIIEEMRKDIEIKVIEESGGSGRRGGGAFSISYTARDPYISMQITSTLASLFIDENLKIREQYAEGTSEFLVSELDKAKQELEEQESALRRFKEGHRGSLPEQLDANLRTLDRLQMELQTVNGALTNAEDRKNMLEGRQNMLEAQLSISSQTPPLVPLPLEIELGKLKTELARLLSVYKENYPDVVTVRGRIKEIEAKLATINEARAQQEKELPSQSTDLQNSNVYADLSAVKSQIVTLKEREAKIQKQIRDYEKRVEDIPANEQKLVDISRDYNISLKNYQALLEKKLSARLAENLEKRQKGEKFRVIDPANLPERPYKPDRVRIILMGVMVGLGAGSGIVFLLEFINPVFRKPEDFAGVLTQPVLTTIPVFHAGAHKKTGRRFMVIRGKKK